MKFKLTVLPYFVFLLHRLLSWTWRYRMTVCDQLQNDLQNGHVAILAHWHADETVLPICIRQVRAGILNSKSSDGQMMAKVVRLYGARTAKGSSSRGGVEGLKGLVRLAKEGRNPAIAVDGPVGPLRVIKPGVLQLSRLCQAPIYPAAVIYSRAWHFPKAWDKTYLPKPFAKVHLHWGDPLPTLSRDDDPKDQQHAARLTQKFSEAEQQAIHFFTQF